MGTSCSYEENDNVVILNNKGEVIISIPCTPVNETKINEIVINENNG